MANKIIQASTGLGHDSEINYQDGKPHPHPQVEDLVNTIGFSLIQELLQYIKGPDGEAALEYILNKQGRVVSNVATTKEARQASRVVAQEFICGSYDAVQRKWSEVCTGLPKSAPFFAILVAAYVCLFAVGLLLTCWRFAFYGLH